LTSGSLWEARPRAEGGINEVIDVNAFA